MSPNLSRVADEVTMVPLIVIDEKLTGRSVSEEFAVWMLIVKMHNRGAYTVTYICRST